jgi:hypothetical protein
MRSATVRPVATARFFSVGPLLGLTCRITAFARAGGVRRPRAVVRADPMGLRYIAPFVADDGALAARPARPERQRRCACRPRELVIPGNLSSQGTGHPRELVIPGNWSSQGRFFADVSEGGFSARASRRVMARVLLHFPRLRAPAKDTRTGAARTTPSTEVDTSNGGARNVREGNGLTRFGTPQNSPRSRKRVCTTGRPAAAGPRPRVAPLPGPHGRISRLISAKPVPAGK